MSDSFSAQLWRDIEDIYGAILAHPFVAGLADGSLAREPFQFYVIQDALYLRKGELSPGNLPLVQRAVNLAAALDRPTASVEETAALLRLPPPQ